MKFKIDRLSFFSPSSSHSATAATNEMGQDSQRIEAARIIQKLWRSSHLHKTAVESYHYVHSLVSVEHAKKEPLPKLEQFIMDPETIKTTHNLLAHLEMVKGAVLPSYTNLAALYHAERLFLPAYMIVAKSELIFESPTDIDEHLLACAEDMLQSFEELCAFMGRLYVKEDAPVSTPLAERTPSADRVFANLYDRRMKTDQLFMTEGRVYLEKFHQKQIDYYNTFTEWEINNRHKLVNILIAKYMDIESYRFKALSSLDPRMLEMYEGYGNQQETLKSRVYSLLGEQGTNMLAEELSTHQALLEANKWAISPTEALIHELALNSDTPLMERIFTVLPQHDLDAAVSALIQTPPRTDELFEVFKEIRDVLIRFTPHNAQQVAQLEQTYSPGAMSIELQTLGLEEGICRITVSLLHEIQRLASPVRANEIEQFLNAMRQGANTHSSHVILLRQALDFIYQKLSQTNFEIHSFYAQDIVPYEQAHFKERLSQKQFSLDFILSWLDKFISSPQGYRLTESNLCSKHVGSYVSQALLLVMLQQPEQSVLHTIPETFYLDRLRITQWHTQYQNILYTVSALSYMEEFCQLHHLKLPKEVLREEKNRLLKLVHAEVFETPKERADDLIAAINRLLKKEHQELSQNEQDIIASVIESCCSGTNRIIPVINKRLGDYLSYYTFKGYAPENSGLLVSRYELTTELNKLGKELVPALRLHSKVHSAFYQQQIEQRLWKPLFATLKSTLMPETLPTLLASERERINKTRTYLDKLGFVLGGLALAQQMVTYSDAWNLNLTIKNTELRRLAGTFNLIEMIHDTRVTKENVERKLKELIQHVANEYEVPYDDDQRNQMSRMLRLAKNGKSPVRNSFVDEVISIARKSVIGSNEEHSSNNLIDEFKEETTFITHQIKESIMNIKMTLLPVDNTPEAVLRPAMRTGFRM